MKIGKRERKSHDKIYSVALRAPERAMICSCILNVARVSIAKRELGGVPASKAVSLITSAR